MGPLNDGKNAIIGNWPFGKIDSTLVKFNMAYERKIVNKSLSSMEL